MTFYFVIPIDLQNHVYIVESGQMGVFVDFFLFFERTFVCKT